MYICIYMYTGISAQSAEWIVQPAVHVCKDACAGLTLRKLTAEVRGMCMYMHVCVDER